MNAPFVSQTLYLVSHRTIKSSQPVISHALGQSLQHGYRVFHASLSRLPAPSVGRKPFVVAIANPFIATCNQCHALIEKP